MRLKAGLLVCLLLGLVVLVIFWGSGNKEHKLITIHTGGKTGTYYPIGNIIARMVHESNQDLIVGVRDSGGSIENLNQLSSGSTDIIIAQADVIQKAWNGEAPFLTKRRSLRALFGLYLETLTLVVREESEIYNVLDLYGKRINIGVAGSGENRTVRQLFSQCGLFGGVSPVIISEMGEGVVRDEMKESGLDGYLSVVGHPAAGLREIMNELDVRLVSIEGGCVQKLMEMEYLVESVIGKDVYGTDHDVVSYGTMAIVLVSQSMSNEMVGKILGAFYGNIGEFTERREIHPVLKYFSRDSSSGVIVPYHNAAVSYYGRLGLVESNSGDEERL